MKRAVGFLVLALAVLAARQAGAATCGNAPGLRECTDVDLNPQAALMRQAPLFAEAVRSVGHVCDRVTWASLDNAPGIVYYHVACDARTRYTIGVSRAHVVVWPGTYQGD